MNKAIIMGRLTADPELRQTPSGVSVCRFTVAVSRKVKNQQGNYDADFISCIAWRQTAEFVSRYFGKGKMIAVEGSLRTGSYKDKNHPDVTHYTTDLYVENVEFCGDLQKNGENQQTNQPSQMAQQLIQNASDYGFEEIINLEEPF